MKKVVALLALSLSTHAFALNISAQYTSPNPDEKALVFNLSKTHFDASNLGSYTHENLLACTPEIKGAYEFSSPNTLTLYPSHSLQAASPYSCRLNKTKYTPQSANSAAFTTRNLSAVIERFGKIITLSFNTQIEPSRLKSLLKISRIEKLSQTHLSFDLSFDEKKHRFAALINEDVTEDRVKVEIDKSISPSLQNSIEETLESQKSPLATFDPKRKTMFLNATPRFLALENGKLAIRLYLPHYFYSSTPIRPFIDIKGMDTFSVSEPSYIYMDERKEYGIPQDNQRYVDISGDFQSNSTYEITIKKGLKSEYDYQLRADQTFSVTMGDRKPFISFESDKPYLSSNGEVGISAVNVPKATIIVEHLLDQNYNYFVTFKGGDADELAAMSNEVARKTFELGGTKNNFSSYKTDLKAFMKDFKSGVYRLTIHYDKDKKRSKSVYYSDIGITAKVAKDQMFIWTAKLSDTSPIEQAEIKIYSDKNELLAKAKSDSDGIAVVNMKNIADKHPKSLVVTSDKQQSFLFLDKALNPLSSPYKESQQDKYKSFIYLQSKLIRPGNDAHILFLLKDKNYLAGAKLPLQVSISDPSGYKVYDKSLHTDAHGAVDLTLFIAETFKTGTYRIAVKLGDYSVGSASFSVENFMPQKIKNEISFKESSLKRGELLHAKIGSRYLFGAPGAHLKAEARLTAVSKVYVHDEYPGFNFNNEILAQSNLSNYLLKNKTLKLNAQGSADILFDTSFSQNPPSILQAQLALTVFDDGRGVSAYKQIDIYPYKSMVGLKIETPTLEKGEKVRASTVAVEPLSGKRLSRQLEVLIKKSDWEYYYDASGYYKWNRRYRDYKRFYIQSGEAIDVKMETSGDYTLEVADRLSGHSSSRNFRVSGWDYTAIDPSSDMAKVQVKIDKQKLQKGFKKGETLHVDIKSPLQQGHMLLNLEADKVLWHKLIAIDKGSASLDIDLDFDLPDGLYLRTHMIRSTDTPSMLIPFRASSYTFIKPDKSANRQELSISAAKTTGSNRIQTIQVKARPHSSVIVSVVDEGILQIKGQMPPKPFIFFERIMKEQLALYDLYDKVMHFKTKGKLLSFGGDGSAKLKRERKHLGAQTGAKRVKPFVYWSKILKADSQGKLSVDLPIPAFNGQAQIVALAFDEKSIGAASQELLVKDDIIIKPTFTRFIHVGDTLQVPLRIFNTSKKLQNIRLSATNSEELALDLNTTSLSLKPESSVLVNALLKGKSFGKGELKITAVNSEDKLFFAQVELPVASAFTLQTEVIKGETSKPLNVSIDKRYFSATNPPLYFTLSDSYLSQLKGSVNALIGYPYGCAEQTASKLLAMLYIDKFVKGSSDQHTQDLLADRKRFIKEGIYKLYGMQKNNGEFGYWNLSGYINPYASIYACDVLLELKKLGFELPEDMLSNIYKALRNQSKAYGSYRSGVISPFERMYAAYLLAREKELDRATVNALYDQKIYQNSILSHYMMAAILKEAKLTEPLNKVLAELETFHYKDFPDGRDLGGSFYSKIRDMAFSLYIHVSYFKKNDLSARLLEGIAKDIKDIDSTQEKAYSIRAMLAHYKDAVQSPILVELEYNKQTKSYDKPLSKEDILTTPEIRLIPKSGLVNYTFEVSNYIEREIQHLPLSRQSSTLKIYRSFVDEEGQTIHPDSLNVGELFYSKISIQSSVKLNNIVISNRIPACFEIVNERLQNHKRSDKLKNSSNYTPDHEEYLDDRVLSFINLQEPLRVYNPLTKSHTSTDNTQTFYQPMRILAQGRCTFPALTAEAMYDSRIQAYDKAYKEITIKQQPKKKRGKFDLSNLLQLW